MSGKSNVIFKLEKLGIDPSKERVEAVLGRAKNSDRLLSDAEVTAAALAAHPA